MLHVPTRPRHVSQREEKIINVISVRKAVIANPHTNTRSVAHDLQLSHKIHRIIKHNLKCICLRGIQLKDYFPKTFIIEKLFVIGCPSK